MPRTEVFLYNTPGLNGVYSSITSDLPTQPPTGNRGSTELNSTINPQPQTLNRHLINTTIKVAETPKKRALNDLLSNRYPVNTRIVPLQLLGTLAFRVS